MQEIDRFYEELWHRPGWNSATPNADESARYGVIRRMLDRILVEACPGATPLSMLDLGCGRGWLSHLLAKEGQVTGLDPVRKVIDAAQQNFPEVRFIAGTVDTLLSDPAVLPFDVIVSSEVIEHVPPEEKPHFLRSVRRLLKPEGYLILTTPRGELWGSWQRLTRAGQPVEAWLTETELSDLCSRASLKVVCRDRAYPIRRLNWKAQALNPVRVLARHIAALHELEGWLSYETSIYQIVLARLAI